MAGLAGGTGLLKCEMGNEKCVNHFKKIKL
jgi:hypothetical protein